MHVIADQSVEPYFIQYCRSNPGIPVANSHSDAYIMISLIKKSYFCNISFIHMYHIPTRKTSEQFQGEIAHMRYISTEKQMPSGNHAHRDDYYIFILIEEGKGKVLIDFEEREITGRSIFCILPGQVHIPDNSINACGWFLAVDSIAVREEYKEIFDKSDVAGSCVKLNEEIFNDLKNYVPIIHKRLNAGKRI